MPMLFDESLQMFETLVPLLIMSVPNESECKELRFLFR